MKLSIWELSGHAFGHDFDYVIRPSTAAYAGMASGSHGRLRLGERGASDFTGASFSPKLLYETFQFPLECHVVCGYDGAREEDSLSQGDIIVLYFLKKETVVVATGEFEGMLNWPGAKA